MPLRKRNLKITEQPETVRFFCACQALRPVAQKSRNGRIALLLVVLLIAAEGFSCALGPPPTPAYTVGSSMTALSDDPAAIQEMARDCLERGDIAGADSILAIALQKKFPRSWKTEFRSMRQTIRKAQFSRDCPLKLEVVEPDQYFSFDDELEVEFKIGNLSPASLTIPSRGFFWWFPFTESRLSLIQIRVALVDVTSDGVISGGSWNETITFDGSLTVAAGGCESFYLELRPVARKKLLYRRIEIEGELIPGGLETDRFDYGMLRFPFEKACFHFVAEGPQKRGQPTVADLRAAIDERNGSKIFRNAVLLDEEEVWAGVDHLISALPSLALMERRMAIAALRIVTDQNLGSDFHRWINWWHEKRPQLLPEDISSRSPRRNTPPGTWGISRAPAGMILLVAGLCPMSTPSAVRSVSLDGGRRNRNGHQPAVAGAEWRDALCSPMFGRRQGAIKEMIDAGAEILDVLEVFLVDADRQVRAGAVTALAKIGGSGSRALLIDALLAEEDRALRQSMVEALARLGVPLPAFRETWPVSETTLLKEIYTKGSIADAMESVVHGGTVPGFYDGQFAHFWDIAPDMAERLVKIAHDPDVHHIIRVLAIMSLPETSRPSLEKDLAPLIIPASAELSREWYSFVNLVRQDAVTEDMVLESRAVSLSGYARYALAKAGMERYVFAKIEVMKRWIDENKAVIDEQNMFKDVFGSTLRLKQEFGRNLYFEIGYEYQQLDDYDRAEAWYLKLIDSFPDSNALANTHYNLACLYSLQNRMDDAIHHLTETMEKGFFDFSWIDKDRDLDNVRKHPKFAALKENFLPSEGLIGDDADEGV